ncbi:MAG TPA: ABC transporter ATP-binding protein [Trueperaceae bacterium]|nr:ABC transporter ATP-binding protein [Trueperaceae bacterium]
MIDVDRLVKTYGRVRAVDDVSFSVPQGRVVALLGPNGAGKSTTIKAITGLLRPSAGHVRVGGFDLERAPLGAKALLGYVPDRPYLYQKLTGRELLRFLGRLRRVADAERKAEAWLAHFGLERSANELIETYSHGMRQKLTFAAALLHEPQALVIDEPMVGLDPRAAHDVRRLMRAAAEGGAAVLLTTHSMDVAEAVADSVLLLDRGRVRAMGTMTELRARVGRSDASLEAIFLQLTDQAADDRAAATARDGAAA